MKVLDYSISKESFELKYNSELDMFNTFPKPENIDLPKYYKSENYISHTDSTKSVMDKIYQLVKTFTISSKVKLISSYSNSNPKLLDIGCGTGEFLKSAFTKGWEVTGVEPNDKASELALLKLDQNKNIFTSIDELITNIPSKKFNVITLWHVLEHIPDYNETIVKIKSLLEPDGILIVAVPNFNSYDAKHYKEFWAAYDVPRHLWHFSKTAIHNIFLKHQMRVEKIIPMYFDSFYVAMLSEKHKTGKSNLIRAFFIGLVSNLKALFSKEFSSLIYVIKNEKN